MVAALFRKPDNSLVKGLILGVICMQSLSPRPAHAVETELVLEGEKPEDNMKYSCGFHRATRKAQSPEQFILELNKTNFDPCCLGPDLLSSLKENTDPLKGIEIGITASVGNLEAGKEFVLFYDAKKAGLTAAVFRYVGAGAGLSLPIASTVTRGLIIGSCQSIHDYAGYFKTTELAGTTRSYGMSRSFLDTPEELGLKGFFERLSNHVNSLPTGCNSKGLNTGPGTGLAALSGSFYEIISPVVQLKGPRIKKLQYLMFRGSGEAAARRNGVLEEKDSTDFNKQHRKTCEYDVPKHLWDTIDIRAAISDMMKAKPDRGKASRSASPSTITK